MNAKRILVVDDEPDLVRALGLRLSSRGYEVLTAFDGVQAMSRIQKERPDLVLLDIHLPAGNGYRVCERMRASEGARETPVIALTADPSAEAQRRCNELGCADFFRKPYDPKELMAAVTRALDSPPRTADHRP
jgi:two-component system, OmpR family, alkaline phosphatase synthesis response regulator PhoP